VPVVKAFFEALNEHDLQRAYSYCAPDAKYLGQPQRAEGLDAVRAVDAAFFEAFPDHSREIEQLVADEQAVVVLLNVSGTNLGSRGGAPPTGRRVQFQVCNLIELRDGRIISMRQIYDSAQIAEQLE
jgi:steroid delta-isomerase-like uncharacterized protein